MLSQTVSCLTLSCREEISCCGDTCRITPNDVPGDGAGDVLAPNVRAELGAAPVLLMPQTGIVRLFFLFIHTVG